MIGLTPVVFGGATVLGGTVRFRRRFIVRDNASAQDAPNLLECRSLGFAQRTVTARTGGQTFGGAILAFGGRRLDWDSRGSREGALDCIIDDGVRQADLAVTPVAEKARSVELRHPGKCDRHAHADARNGPRDRSVSERSVIRQHVAEPVAVGMEKAFQTGRIAADNLTFADLQSDQEFVGNFRERPVLVASPSEAGCRHFTQFRWRCRVLDLTVAERRCVRGKILNRDDRGCYARLLVRARGPLLFVSDGPSRDRSRGAYVAPARPVRCGTDLAGEENCSITRSVQSLHGQGREGGSNVRAQPRHRAARLLGRETTYGCRDAALPDRSGECVVGSLFRGQSQ